jgi:hypothetical protein
MKQLTYTSILIFVFFLLSFAQDGKNDCPKIKIDAPEGMMNLYEPIFFSVELNEEFKKLKIEYEWNVLSGKVEQGQRTSRIKVLPETAGIQVTANVKIKGLPENCENTASEFVNITPAIEDYFPNEYGKIPFKEELARLDELIVIIANTPGFQGFIKISISEKASVVETKKHIRKLLKYIKYRGFSKERFIFAIKKTNYHKTELQAFPEGTKFPDCENCEIIKGKNL